MKENVLKIITELMQRVDTLLEFDDLITRQQLEKKVFYDKLKLEL